MRSSVFRFAIALLGLMLVCLPVSAQEQDPDTTFTDEPDAHALYDKMLETMRDAETIYYECEHQWEAQGLKLGRCTYRIWMKKPNYVRIEASSYVGGNKGILVGDGEYFWIYWPAGRPFFPGTDTTEYERTRLSSYMRKPAPTGMHSIAHDVGLLGVGMSMTILEPSVFHGYNDPMEPYLDGVRGMGTESVGDEECHVIEASFMDHQRSRYIWLSKFDNLPRKLEEVVRLETGILKQEFWSDVSTNDDMPMEKFAWKPPQGWVQYQTPELEEGLLKVGVDAPDFEAISAEGETLRLSDYRGRVVWLVFWRVGCQGCRETLPILQRLYKKYQERDFVVLGFNCADKKKIAVDFLRELSVSFPNIIDASDGAQKVFYREYQRMRGRSAVPLTYVMDRDGKVVEAWYGFDDDERRVQEKVEGILSK